MVFTAVDLPVLRFIEGTKHSLLRGKENDVLIMSVNYSDCPELQRFEGAIFLQVLTERQPLAFAFGVADDPGRQRQTGHPVGLGLAGEREDGRRQRRLVGREGNAAALLLVRHTDDERNVNHRTGHVLSLVLVDTPLKALSVIRRNDYRGVAHSPAFLESRHEGAEATIGRQDELVVTQPAQVDLGLLIRRIVRNPAASSVIPLVFKFLQFRIREKGSSRGLVGMIRRMRCHYMDPKKKTVRQFFEYFLRMFEAFMRR